MSLSAVLIIVAVLVIAPLAWYAWSLTRKVHRMEAQQAKEEAEAELQLRKYQEELIFIATKCKGRIPALVI